jgi:hypothetical protein
LVALLKDEFHRYIFKPQFEIEVSSGPKHLNKVRETSGTYGQHIEEVAWLGLTLRNVGMGVAKNVSVYFEGVSSNCIDNFYVYRSLPLRIGWLGGTSIRSLHPEMYTRWDICELRKEIPGSIRFRLHSTPNELDMIDITKTDGAKTFTFDVIAVGDNVTPRRKRITVGFEGRYTDGFVVS